jgi:hypothetical protein
MLQSELLAEITARPEILSVGPVMSCETDPSTGNPIGPVNGLEWKYVNVLEVSTDGKRGYRKNIRFYVHQEGEAEESAYYTQNEPNVTLDVAEQFSQNVLDYIYDQDLAEFADLVFVDNIRQRVLAKLYIQVDSTTAEVKDAILWKQDAGVQIRYL